MPFPAKTLAISHFRPFSKQVKNGKKASISCYFHAISDRLLVKNSHSTLNSETQNPKLPHTYMVENNEVRDVGHRPSRWFQGI
jgi:hypothetical protein